MDGCYFWCSFSAFVTVVWLHITRRAGLRASPETPHLLHDSQNRPGVKVRIGSQAALLDVRTCSTITTLPSDALPHLATPPKVKVAGRSPLPGYHFPP